MEWNKIWNCVLEEKILSKKVYLITGGCGFIGSCLIRELLKDENIKVINIDKLSYASNPSAIGEVSKDYYIFYQ